MTRLTCRSAVAAGSVATLSLSLMPMSVAAARGDDSSDHRLPQPRHVLLLSVDGMHQSDLQWYVSTHPESAMARLVRLGTSYRNAMTPGPSDSFPGLLAQVTGGNPRSTGIYYDVSFDRALLPPGTTSCAAVVPGAQVSFDESADRDPSRLDAGQGLTGLPGSILSMTGQPSRLIDPAKLPVSPATCAPVYPHAALRVNTVFEVATAAGLRTAWSDKHPAYEILNGPTGTGVADLFTPEINSAAPTAGDWTKDNALTRQYDGYKVTAVLNELGGYEHSGTRKGGVPAILGMNFQAVSTAQKLPTSGGQPGGYLPGGVVPGPVLRGALDFVDASLGSMQATIHAQGLDRSTSIILSAKHGQSPTDSAALTRIDDGPLISGLNEAWRTAHPGAGDLVTFSINDDSMLLWLSERSEAATSFAKTWLLDHPATGTTIDGATRVLPSSGLTTVYAGAAAARFYGVPVSESRHPDLVGAVIHGVVYTGGTGKIAEHGGMDPQDRHVPLVVSGARSDDATRHEVEQQRSDRPGGIVTAEVETTQIAPTILETLGLDPRLLKAVRLEGTNTLPAPGQR